LHTQVNIIFTISLSSYPFSCHLPLPTGANYLPPQQNIFSPLVFSDFVKEKTKMMKR
jgi:hypothetical protein